jgi:hypothetical protein
MSWRMCYHVHMNTDEMARFEAETDKWNDLMPWWETAESETGEDAERVPAHLVQDADTYIQVRRGREYIMTPPVWDDEMPYTAITI